MTLDLGVSNEGRIIFEEKSTGQTFMFYMSIVPAPGKFLLTSLVRIRPGTVCDSF